MPGARQNFDKRYYDRYYRNARTRVTSRAQVAVLGRMVCAYAALLRQPVRRVLDAGCGLGYWRGVIAEHYPRASYLGIEVSDYLCQQLGWTKASIADYTPRGRFDLVICQGVLQYLDRAAAAAALDNLGRLCRGVLYLEALTREDWQHNCDRSHTDRDVHLRSAGWYRKQLGKSFATLGGGLFLHRDADAVRFALESC